MMCTQYTTVDLTQVDLKPDPASDLWILEAIIILATPVCIHNKCQHINKHRIFFSLADPKVSHQEASASPVSG